MITYIDYSITEKLYRKDAVLLAVHTSGASPQSSASHLLTFLVAQLQFLREWKLSDRRLYEFFERRLLICGNPKERNRRQIKKHAFFLRHSVYSKSTITKIRLFPSIIRSSKLHIQRHVFVRPLLLPAASVGGTRLAAGSSNGLTNT